MAKVSKKTGIVIFWILFFVGMTIRLLSSYYQYSGDVNNHIEWAKSFEQGALGFYERAIPGYETPNYPPLAIYFFYGSYKLWEFANKLSLMANKLPIFPSNIVWFLQSKNALAMFMKLPSLVADVGIFYWLFVNRGKKIASLFWLNPAFIYLSSVWGQIESLTTYFIILAIDYFHKNKPTAGLTTYTLGFLTKQIVLWVYPVIFGLYRNIKDMALSIAVFTSLTIAMYAPFYGFSFLGVSHYIKTLSGSSQMVSDKAFNLWGILYGQGVSDGTLLGPLSVRMWSMLVLIILGLFFWFLYRKNNKHFELAFILSLVFFFFQTRVHERHLYPAVVLLLLTTLKYKHFVYTLLSIYLLSNLYWSLGLPFI